MACVLRADPRKVFCALGHGGDKPLVFLEGPDTLKVTNASLNGKSVPVLPKNRIQLTALDNTKPGTNRLELTIEGVKSDDIVTLFEQCEPDDDEDTVELCEKTIAEGAGGEAEVFLLLRIHAD